MAAGLGLALFAAALGFATYTYLVYPGILWILAAGRNLEGAPMAAAGDWPTVSISLPVYNERTQIRAELESLLSLDYPADRLQILVISDSSDDGTDEIVRQFASRGVELLRLETRGGKTAAENAARPHMHGEIIVNTDASIRIAPPSLKCLVSAFSDPFVGLASGRDVSVRDISSQQNAGESGYVGYEMWIRSLETRAGGIVGASGCFFAIRADLHHDLLPTELSRDFAAALITKEHGYRAISVDEAVCYVARTSMLRDEYRRKVRTMSRGMQTLAYKRRLLNPFLHGRFAWMLFSHKVCRWLVPWVGLAGLAGLALLALNGTAWAVALLGVAVLLGSLALVGWAWPQDKPLPAIVSLPSYVVLGNVAAIHAGFHALRGDMSPTWDPTRRDVLSSSVIR